MDNTDPKRLIKHEIKKLSLKGSEYSLFDDVRKRVDLLERFVKEDNKITPSPFLRLLNEELGFLEFAEDTDKTLEIGYMTKETKDSASKSLLYAVALGKIGIAKNLVQNHEADVNYQDEEKNTPLLIALKRKKFKMVEWLLQNGAQVKGTRQGDEAKKIVCMHGLVLALPLLKKYGVDFMKPYVRVIHGRSIIPLKRIKIYPIIVAALTNQKQIVEILTKDKMPSDVLKEIEKALTHPKRFNKEIRIILGNAFLKQKGNSLLEKHNKHTYRN